MDFRLNQSSWSCVSEGCAWKLSMKACHVKKKKNLMIPEKDSTLNSSNYQLMNDLDGNFYSSRPHTHETITSLGMSGTCVWKSACVVIIDDTFVVAMQKKGSCAIFPLQSFEAVTLSKRATVCLVRSGSPWWKLCVKGGYFSIRVHLHRALSDLANSRSPWVDFCCIYHATYSLHLKS